MFFKFGGSFLFNVEKFKLCVWFGLWYGFWLRIIILRLFIEVYKNVLN